MVFEGEQGRKYATAIGKILDGVQGALEEISDEPNEGVSVLSIPVGVLCSRRRCRMKSASCEFAQNDMKS